MTTLNLLMVIICGIATIINIIVLGLNIKFFTEFAKERMQARRHDEQKKTPADHP